MKKHALRAFASRAALIAGVASSLGLISTSAFAQAAASDDSEKIVVTGSRIVNPGLASPTPVTSVSSNDLNNMAPTGIADALDDVPAFFNNSNATTDSSSNVPSARGSNVNLRGLDPSRTLVLLDGRRVVPGSKIGTVNIDLIPQDILKRVDIVTGGASATYGTDAVAGVVNFVLDDDFTGVRGNIQGGLSSRADNPNGQIGISIGTDVGNRAHLILSGQVYTENGIEENQDRPWTATNWGTIVNPFGSTPARITVPDLVPDYYSCQGMIIQPGSALNNLEFQNDGTVSPFVFTELHDSNNQSVTNGGSGCNAGLADKSSDNAPRVTNDVRRANGFAHFKYDLTNDVSVFLQAIVARNMTGQMGQSAYFRKPWQFTIYRENPYLPQSVADIMDTEGLSSFTFQKEAGPQLLGNAELDVINTTVELTGGIDATINTGGLFDGWDVNAYYQWGENTQLNRFYGSADWQHIVPALDAVVDSSGNIQCRAKVFGNADYNDCVPLNLFGTNDLTDAQLRYATTSTEKDQAILHQFVLHEQVVEGVASGQIIDGWAGPISAAFGASYRRQAIDSTCVRGCNDGIHNTDLGLRGIPTGIEGDPDIQEFGSYADVDGSFDVKELFAEALIPLVSDAPLMKSLVFSPSVRWADYSGSGSIWAYKFGLDWQLDDAVRLRGTYSRDVRAATLAERYDQQRANGTVTDDPVTGASYNFSQTTGGNPNVNPENADTITVGAVLTPSALRGFSATVDWFDINITGAIGSLTTQQIIDRCAAGATTLCNMISRDPTTHFIFDVQNLYLNLNRERARGIDVELNYKTDLNIIPNLEESLNLRVLGTMLMKRSKTIDGVTIDSVGQIPPGGDIREPAYPKYVASALITYDFGPFSMFAQERFYNKGTQDLTKVVGVDLDRNSVPAIAYTDVRFSYTTDNGNWELFVQGLNLTDRGPPIIANTSFYDVKGRRFLAGARFNF